MRLGSDSFFENVCIGLVVVLMYGRKACQCSSSHTTVRLSKNSQTNIRQRKELCDMNNALSLNHAELRLHASASPSNVQDASHIRR